MQTLKRPLLAVINEDYPKFKDITNDEDLEGIINYLITLMNIKVSSKEEKDSLNIQMIVIMDFVRTKFGFLTTEEIREAFKMYVAKDFGHKEIYRNLDTILVSDVLNCFMDFRSDALRAYETKKRELLTISEKPVISEEEKRNIVKNGVERVFSEYKENKKLEDSLEYVFDFLVNEKLIKSNLKEEPNLAKYFMAKIEIAKNELIAEEKEKVNILEPSKSVETFKKIREGISPAINIRAKKLVLIDFFDRQIKLGREKIFES